jgi:starch synthase
VPIVREVGGLADTVTPFDPATGGGTGFVFKDYTAEAMLTAIEQAVKLYAKKRQWGMLKRAGMEQDFSWESSARKYAELFLRMSAK